MDNAKDYIHDSIIQGTEPTVFREELNEIKLRDEDELMRVLNDQRYPPLREAARYGRNQLAQILLEFGADRTLRDPENDLAVHTAAKYDQVEVLKTLLVNAENDIEKFGKHDWSPLLCAIYYTSKNSVTYILENHKPACFSWNCKVDSKGPKTHPLYFAASVIFAESDNSTVVMRACIKGIAREPEKKYSSSEIMRLLMDHGCPTDCEGEHLVIEAVRVKQLAESAKGVLHTLKNLVEHGKPSKLDLKKAKEIVERRLSETTDEKFRRNLEQVRTYLTNLMKITDESTS